MLERALASDIHHPGACHLYVHITESTSEPGRASACAEFLGQSIPGASHINHMPSHTWTQVGRWGDAVRASLDAWHSDLKSLVGEGVAIYPWHDLQMLVFAASMDGQGAIAIQAGRDYSRMTKNPIYLLLTLVRFGRFEDILVDLNTKTEGLLSGPVWDFAQGYAQLRAGNRVAAQTHLASVTTAANTSTAQFGANTAKAVFGVLGGILEGEIALGGADRVAAISAFERAVAIEDALVWDEPEPLPFSARHWLGAALIEAGRPADAETVYREDLKRHPKNGWALLGLSQALAAQKKPSRRSPKSSTAPGPAPTPGSGLRVSEESPQVCTAWELVEAVSRPCTTVANERASEPRDRSEPSKRRARARVGESEGQSPSVKTRR